MSSSYWRRSIIGLLITVPLLVLLLRRVDFGETRTILAGADYKLLLLAMAGFVASIWLQAARW